MERVNIWAVIVGMLFLAGNGNSFAANDVGDPSVSVVDVMQANRLIDVDPGDQFWLTVPAESGLAGVQVHREGDRGWTWLKAGDVLRVQYDEPGEYTIRFRTARALVVAPFTVRVFAPPPDTAEPRGHSNHGRGGGPILASSSGPSFSVGSVYAGLYPGGINKFPMRIVSQGAGSCTVSKYGGGWSRTYTFTGPGETSDVVDVPTGETWTLLKSSGGTHTLSTNSPSRLKVVDLILTTDLGHAPAPGTVASQTWYALTNEVVTLRVMPGPFWVTNNPAASASLFDWTTNSIALPATTNLTQTFSPGAGTHVVNVACRSPYPATPTSQTTTILGVAVTATPSDQLEVFLNTKDYIEVKVEPSEAAPYIRLTIQPDGAGQTLATFANGNATHVLTSAEQEVEVFGANVFNGSSGNSTGQNVITFSLVTPGGETALASGSGQTLAMQSAQAQSQQSEFLLVKVFSWSLEKLADEVKDALSEENLRNASADQIASQIKPVYEEYMTQMLNSGDQQMVDRAYVISNFVSNGGLKTAILDNLVGPLLDFAMQGYNAADKTAIDGTSLISLGHIKGHKPQNLGATSVEWEPIIRWGGFQDFVNYAQGDLGNINKVLRAAGVKASKNLPLIGDYQPKVELSGTITLGTDMLSLDPADTTQSCQFTFNVHSTRGLPKSAGLRLQLESSNGKMDASAVISGSVSW